MTREEWLEARRKGIGGSDAAAVCGLNPYKSPLEVYLEKIGEIDSPEDNDAMYWGRKLEDIVAREFSERTGLKVRRVNSILTHKEFPFILGNLDRIIIANNEGPGVLECKTSSAYSLKNWGEEVPPMYQLQVQHYLAVTGYKYGYVAVLIGGRVFRYFRVDRDEDLIANLIKIESDFWHNHVLAGVMPEPDGNENTSKLLSKLYPESNGKAIVLKNPETKSLLERYFDLEQQEKEIKTQKDEVVNKLKSFMQDNELALCDGYKISWKNIISNRFDTKAFQKDYPELYKKYFKKSCYRRFQVNHIK